MTSLQFEVVCFFFVEPGVVIIATVITMDPFSA